MKKLSSTQIRQIWLDFWKSKEHLIVPPASLIPKDDPSLLWINSGVATLKNYFDGTQKPPAKRLANSQKAIRTNDIENVGKTARHHTLFEMMGNFSIGDYFKEEALTWAYELLTDKKWFDIDPELLYVTVYPDDKEAKEIWLKIGMPENHIFEVKDNFWDIGSGPSGPDSEIFFDRGKEFQDLPDDDPEMYPGGENERYLEIWNNVFSQFNHLEGLTDPKDYPELPQKNIDTGAGLERFASVFQGTKTNFETDLFLPIIQAAEKISGKKYGDNEHDDVSFKVIADHIRAIVFAIGDGASPSNEGRGYVIRRLLRRAVLHGQKVGIKETFLETLVPIVGQIMGSYYPELHEQQEKTQAIIREEEVRFSETLSDGLLLFESVANNSKKTGKISGEDAFKLYDTYGFPLELTQEKAEEVGLTVDVEEFDHQMQQQRNRARAARTNGQSMNTQSETLLNLDVDSKYVGWSQLEVRGAQVVAIIENDQLVDSISNGQATLIFDQTPFYAEMGGQIADTGQILSQDRIIGIVQDVSRGPNGQHIHLVDVKQEIKIGEKVDLLVDISRHKMISQNHTATHMLDQALRNVLGDTHQAGSLVAQDYLRFDFTWNKPLTEEQLQEVEDIVNMEIQKNSEISWLETDIQTAQKMGAVAVFGEKYGEIVRVVSIGDFNKEFDGGTHANTTGELSVFKIIAESGIGSGVRRIEAVTGQAAISMLQDGFNQIKELAGKLKVQKISDVSDRVDSLQNDYKTLQKKVEDLYQKFAAASAEEIFINPQVVNGYKLITARIDDIGIDGLRKLADQFNAEKNADILLLATVTDGKVNMLAASNVIDKIKAGELIKAVSPAIGGSGGGRPDLAQAGGTNANGIDQAFKLTVEFLQS